MPAMIGILSDRNVPILTENDLSRKKSATSLQRIDVQKSHLVNQA